MPKSYRVRNVKEMEGVLAFLSYENNVNIFSGIIGVDKKKRIGQLTKQGKLKILIDPKTKLTVKGNKIKVVEPATCAVITIC